MAYRIEYRTAQKERANLCSRIRLPILIVLCFALFLLLVESLWPEGASLIVKTVFSHKEVIAVSALNELADELRYGKALTTALADFSRKLIS